VKAILSRYPWRIELRLVKLGKKSLITAESLEALVARLADEARGDG